MRWPSAACRSRRTAETAFNIALGKDATDPYHGDARAVPAAERAVDRRRLGDVTSGGVHPRSHSERANGSTDPCCLLTGKCLGVTDARRPSMETRLCRFHTVCPARNPRADHATEARCQAGGRSLSWERDRDFSWSRKGHWYLIEARGDEPPALPSADRSPWTGGNRVVGVPASADVTPRHGGRPRQVRGRPRRWRAP